MFYCSEGDISSLFVQQLLRQEVQQFFHRYQYLLRTSIVKIKGMEMKKILLAMVMINLVTSTCLDSYEQDGECSKCSSLSFLDGGRCYLKIRGCLQNAAGPICLECQNGYVIDKGLCIREAVYYNLTSLAPSVIKVERLKPLSYSQIRSILGEKYGSEFPKVHKYLLTAHPELVAPKIVSVKILETKREALVKVSYQLESGVTYQGIVKIDLYNIIDELSFFKNSEENNDPIQVQKIVREKNAGILKKFYLYNFVRNQSKYLFNYLNAQNELVRITVNKETFKKDGGIILKSTIFELIIEQILSKFPTLKEKVVTDRVQVTDQIFIVEFDRTASVSIEFFNYEFKINAPIFKLPTPKPTTHSQPFADITDFSAPDFISATEFCYRQFYELNDAVFTKAESQTLKEDGKNFRFTFLDQKKKLIYVLTVHHTVSGINTLASAFKNSEQIYFPDFNHNIDRIFLSISQEIQKQSSIANLPPIQSVIKKVHEEIFEFIVYYSESQIAYLAYDSINKQATLLEFMINKENVLEILNPELKNQAKFRNQIVLFAFLNEKKPETVGGKIQHIEFDAISSYDLFVVTYSGTFLATINDIEGSLVLSVFNKISNDTCYELTKDFIKKNEKVQYISKILSDKYLLEGFQVQLIQAKVNEENVEYRYIFSSETLKQIEIRLVEEAGQARVLKASVLNFGYEILLPEPQNQDYAIILEALKDSGMKGDLTPFYTETNQTNLRAYYDDGSSTIEITINKESKGGKGVIIGSRDRKLIPDEIELSNLIRLSTAPPDERFKVELILRAALKKYTKFFTDPEIRFVEKRKVENSEKYLIFCKTQTSYVKFHATILRNVQTGSTEVILEQLILTDYQDQDFSTCSSWNMEGKCLSCQEDEVEYQGSCQKKMEGCVIQAGSLCVKCNSNYVRSNFKCFRNCSELFN